MVWNSGRIRPVENDGITDYTESPDAWFIPAGVMRWPVKRPAGVKGQGPVRRTTNPAAMKIKFRRINYERFCRKIMPVAVRWHRQQWADQVTSNYYGRYGLQKGKKKDLYYLEINKIVYMVDSVETLINLDHDLYMKRMTNTGTQVDTDTGPGINYCSFCAHKDGCPFLSFAYQVRKKACLFIPVFHLAPTGKMELDNLKRAESRLITDVVMSSIYTERAHEGPAFEPCMPIAVYKHTFTFSQLQ